MLEAVNSVMSNAPLLRGQSEQQSQSRALATNPDSVQVAPQAPFISPYIHMDVHYGKAVLALRDSETGDFLTTIPSDAKLQAQAQDMARRAYAEVTALTSEPQQEQVATAPVTPQAAPQAQINSAAFGAFAKQVASLQTAIAGGGNGGTVSTFA